MLKAQPGSIHLLCCSCNHALYSLYTCVSDGNVEELSLCSMTAAHSLPGHLQPWLSYDLQNKAVNAWPIENRASSTFTQSQLWQRPVIPCSKCCFHRQLCWPCGYGQTAIRLSCTRSGSTCCSANDAQPQLIKRQHTQHASVLRLTTLTMVTGVQQS